MALLRTTCTKASNILKPTCKYLNTSITRSALDLAHRIHGPSPTPNSVPIVVLHGLLGSKRNWESMCKKITASTHRTVIAVDARNHGDSPHSTRHSYIDLAEDISQLISKFATEKVCVIGHSMGGRTAMVLALTEPAKIASLVVVDISPMSTASALGDFFPDVLKVMSSVDFKSSDSLSKAKSIAKEQIASSGLFTHESEQLLLMNIGKLPDKTFGWKCNVYALQNNIQEIATFPNMAGKMYHGPTLFIGGQLSYYIPREDITGIRQYFPNAEIQYINDAGHNVHAENPNEFLRTVMEFLSYGKINKDGI